MRNHSRDGAFIRRKTAPSFVLTPFLRIEAGEARGDPEVIAKIGRLVFRI